MNTKDKGKLKTFILEQLKTIATVTTKNYKKNDESRSNNPFVCFSKGIDKFMGLARSIDSQVGSRMQNIIFYLSRLRYGEKCVPNIILITTDNKSLTAKLKFYYTDGCLDLGNFYANKNPCQQKIYINKQLSLGQIKKIIGTKKKLDIIKEWSCDFSISSSQIKELNDLEDEYYLVDLLYIENSQSQKVINTFEIKMSGYIDTKNAKSNAEEVQRLFNIFKMTTCNKSYFAVCYGECSIAVKNKMKKVAPNGKILTATNFWNLILPNNKYILNYDEFIKIYKAAFSKSKLEDTIKSL